MLMIYWWRTILAAKLSRKFSADKLANLLGFKTVKQNRVCKGLKEVFEFYSYIAKESLPFGIDAKFAQLLSLMI